VPLSAEWVRASVPEVSPSLSVRICQQIFKPPGLPGNAVNASRKSDALVPKMRVGNRTIYVIFAEFT